LKLAGLVREERLGRSESLSVGVIADKTSRILAGIVGGYAVASATAIFLSCVLPLPQAEAILIATLPSFAVYASAIVWAFAARTAVLAWASLLLLAALLIALAWML